MQPYVSDAARRKLPLKVLPSDKARNSDLAAALGVIAILVQVLFAQLTLALAICFLIAGRLSRWRPAWLALPAATGLVWILTIGVRPAAGGFLAAAGRLIAVLAARGTLPARLARVPRVLTDWRLWLPGQLPVALLAASAQAAVLRLAASAGPAQGYRRGAITFMRGRYLTATLRRGEVATADGCCLGVISETGGRAAVSWAEAEAGVLCTGEPPAAVTATGLTLAVAAIQHRKTVIVIDLAAEQPRIDPIGAACTELTAPLRRFGEPGTHYDPLSGASPARATSLVMAMLDWTGVPHAGQLACANYLNAALSLIGDQPSERVLAELVSLLDPEALRQRLAGLRGQGAIKVTELLSRIDGDQTVLRQIAAQLSALGAAGVGAWLRPLPGVGYVPGVGYGTGVGYGAGVGSGAGAISIRRALAEREVAHFELGGLRQAQAAKMIARLAVADLVDALGERIDTGWRGDCAVWINGCEVIDDRQLGALIALGERTGAAVILGTSAASAASRLAAEVNVIVVRGSAGEADIGSLEALLADGGQERLALSVQRPAARLTGCEAVR